MEFKDIKYFVETCNRNSFSEAASKLFITQQALSKSIAKLEAELRCTLFKRTVKGIEMTEDGYYLCNQFLPLIMSFRDTARHTTAYLRKEITKLALCCTPGVIRNISPELLITFEEQYPNIELEINELSDTGCEEYIQQDIRRIGMMLAPISTLKNLHNYIIVKTEPAYLMVHKDHPFAACQSISLGMLRNEPILSYGKTSSYLEIINNVIRPFDFFVKPIYETTDMTLLCELVGKGVGVFVCSRQAYEESRLNNIVLVPLKERSADFCIAFVFYDYMALDAAAKQFIQFIVSNAGNSN